MSVETPHPVNHDEIDIFDLIDDIKDKWYWLLGTVVVALCLAAAYAYNATPVYQTQIVYKQVAQVDLLPVNQPRLQDVFSISSEEAFKEVRALARSGNTKRAFYEQLLSEQNEALSALIYDQALTAEQNFSRFAQRFVYVDPGAKDTDVHLTIKFELNDAEWATALLNRFSDFVLQSYLDEVRNTVELSRQSILDALRLEADGLRTQYHAHKNQRILTLQEAASIAASVKQQQPFYAASNNVVLSAQPPLFMMGQTALNAELEQLRGRAERDEDAYIAGLPELTWKIQNLEDARIDWDRVRFVQLDESAVLPLKPVKPRKQLIIALGGALGLMAGTMFALLAAAYVRRRKSKRGSRRGRLAAMLTPRL